MTQLRNSDTSYGWPANTFHWVMALLILGMLAVGLYMAGLKGMSPDKLKLYGLHKSTGIIVLFLAFLRLTWREVNYQPKIPETKKVAPGIFKLMEFAAKFTHALIYVLMFAMPLSGWLMSSALGFPVSVYGEFTMPNLIAPDKDLGHLLEKAHDYMAYTLIALLCMHVGAALFHHFILRDTVLRRMLPWVLVILFVTPANAATNWQVDKAKSLIKFEAVENGATVTGEFKDYDAVIAFSSDDIGNSKAAVTIKLASVSASYDEVASNLKTADWFDVAKFPEAKFVSQKFIIGNGPGYGVLGNLTIRDKTKPVTINFNTKQIDAKHIVVDGTANLKRTDFGVGQGEWKDTGNVKDDVKVAIHLEAISK